MWCILRMFSIRIGTCVKHFSTMFIRHVRIGKWFSFRRAIQIQSQINIKIISAAKFSTKFHCVLLELLIALVITKRVIVNLFFFHYGNKEHTYFDAHWTLLRNCTDLSKYTCFKLHRMDLNKECAFHIPFLMMLMECNRCV